MTIEVSEGAGADVYRWLAADPPVRSFGASAVPGVRADDDESMGIGFDLLNLIIPNAIALAGLFTSLAAFRDQRRATTGTPPAITVAAGATVVTVTSAADAQALADRLTQAQEAAPAQRPPAPGPATPEATARRGSGGWVRPGPYSSGCRAMRRWGRTGNCPPWQGT